LNSKIQGPDTTIFNAWNKIESLKQKLKLWLNMITEGNNEMLQSYCWIPSRSRAVSTLRDELMVGRPRS